MKTVKKSVAIMASAVLALGITAGSVSNLSLKDVFATDNSSVTTFEMVDGAAVRLAMPSGIRYTASISETDYTALTADNATVTFGMFILPNAYRTSVGEINESNAFTAPAYYWATDDGYSVTDTTGKTQIVHCSASELTQTDDDGTYYFACALTNVLEENYEVDFFARAYYQVNGGDRVWADLNETNVRSISYVSQKALGDKNYTPTADGKATLSRYATQFEKVDTANGTVSLYVPEATTVATVSVGGEEVTAQATNSNEITFPLTAKGRQSATLTTTDGSTWDVPFVHADYVIKTYDDFKTWVATNKTGTKDDRTYTVFARDIEMPSTESAISGATNYANYCDVDGYGHSIINLKTKSWGILNSINYTYVRDLALINATTTGNTVLAGTVSNATGAISNVFLSGKNTSTSSTSKFLLIGYISSTNTVVNCVVIDESTQSLSGTANGVLGAIDTNKVADLTKAFISNTVVVTDGYALPDLRNDRELWGGMVTKDTDVNAKIGTNDTDGLKAALKALAAKDNNWTYNETTTELSLCGNVVFTVDD